MTSKDRGSNWVTACLETEISSPNRIHVWYICLHLVEFLWSMYVNVSKYTRHGSGMGHFIPGFLPNRLLSICKATSWQGRSFRVALVESSKFPESLGDIFIYINIYILTRRRRTSVPRAEGGSSTIFSGSFFQWIVFWRPAMTGPAMGFGSTNLGIQGDTGSR